MKYRFLSDEELIHFEEDLKHFLIMNDVTNEAWELMNQKAPEKARELVGIFSDSVLQKVYEKIKFLEFRSEDSCMVFHFAPEQVEVISLQRIAGSHADLSDAHKIHEALSEKAAELKAFRSSKPYTEGREAELHKMLEQGCIVSSERFWNALLEIL